MSQTSPMEIIVNDQKFYRNDTRSLVTAGILLASCCSFIGINEYDMVEVKVLKNGGRPIPGNGIVFSPFSLCLVTIADLYTALGDRLKKMKMDVSGNNYYAFLFTEPMSVEAPKEEHKEEPKEEHKEEPKEEPKEVTPAVVSAPAAVKPFSVKAPAPVNAFSIKAPKATNAFSIKPKATNAFTIKPIVKSDDQSVEKPADETSASATPAPAAPVAPVAPAPVTAPVTAPAPVTKPAFAVKTNAFAVKSGINKFAIKKP